MLVERFVASCVDILVCCSESLRCLLWGIQPDLFLFFDVGLDNSCNNTADQA